MINQSESLTIKPGIILRSLAYLPVAYGILLYFMQPINPVYILVLTGLISLATEKLLAMRRGGRKVQLRTVIWGGIFSICLSATLFLRRKMNFEAASLDPIHSLELIYLALIFFAALPICVLLSELCRDLPILGTSSRKKRNLLTVIFTVVIALMYAAPFLCYYPAIASSAALPAYASDGGAVVPRPILYSLAVKLTAGNAQLNPGDGLALFSLIQMGFMVFSAAYTINWMMKKRLHPFFAAIAAIYYGLPPIFAAFSMTMQNDIPYGAAVLLFALCIYDLMESDGRLLRSPPGIIRFLILGYLVGMLNTSGLYVLSAVSLILLLFFLLKHKVKASLLLILPAVLVLGSNRLAYGMGAERDFPVESYSIPVQQLARTYTEGGEISAAQKEELEQYFDLKQLKKYDPYLADPAIKSLRQDHVNQNKSGFIRLWYSLFKSNPQPYTAAYLLQTHSYWNLGDKAGELPDTPGTGAVEFGIEKSPLIMIEGINTGNIRPFDFISIGLMVWIMLFCAMSLIQRKQYRKLTALLPILSVWVSLMLTASGGDSLRYIYALPLSLPVILFMLLAKDGPIIPDTPETKTDGEEEKDNPKSEMADVYSFSESAKTDTDKAEGSDAPSEDKPENTAAGDTDIKQEASDDESKNSSDKFEISIDNKEDVFETPAAPDSEVSPEIPNPPEADSSPSDSPSMPANSDISAVDNE